MKLIRADPEEARNSGSFTVGVVLVLVECHIACIYRIARCATLVSHMDPAEYRYVIW